MILPSSRTSLQWRHNGRDGVPNHQPHDCLLNRLFKRRSKKTSKLRVTGLCAGNSPVTAEFPTQSNAENTSIWWRHHDNSPRARVCVLLCVSSNLTRKHYQYSTFLFTSNRYSYETRVDEGIMPIIHSTWFHQACRFHIKSFSQTRHILVTVGLNHELPGWPVQKLISG